MWLPGLRRSVESGQLHRLAPLQDSRLKIGVTFWVFTFLPLCVKENSKRSLRLAFCLGHSSAPKGADKNGLYRGSRGFTPWLSKKMSDFGKVSKSGSNRVNRGGNWNNSGDNLRCGNRNNNNPSNRNNNIGFRPCSTGAPRVPFLLRKERQFSASPDAFPARGV